MSSPFNNPAGRAPEQANAYVDALFSLLGARDPMEELPLIGTRLRAAIAGANVLVPEAPGKWSIHQVVSHLADSEVVWGWRLRLTIAQDRPPLSGYDQDAWSARLAAAYPDTESAIRTLEILRAGHVALLRALSDWDREGLHVERGAESVRKMSKLYAGHDLVHLNQIARIRASL